MDQGVRATCQNACCAFYLISDGGHVVKKGFNKAGHQIYQCRHCGRHFNETVNTPLFHSKLSEEDVILIGRLLNELNGIRAIERITGHHRDTVMRVARRLAMHAGFLSNALGNGLDSGADLHEVDEMWTFAKKRRA